MPPPASQNSELPLIFVDFNKAVMLIGRQGADQRPRLMRRLLMEAIIIIILLIAVVVSVGIRGNALKNFADDMEKRKREDEEQE